MVLIAVTEQDRNRPNYEGGEIPPYGGAQQAMKINLKKIKVKYYSYVGREREEKR